MKDIPQNTPTEDDVLNRAMQIRGRELSKTDEERLRQLLDQHGTSQVMGYLHSVDADLQEWKEITGRQRDRFKTITGSTSISEAVEEFISLDDDLAR